MDFGSAARPSPVAQQPLASTEVVGARSAATLELRPSQTVQSAPAGEAVKLDIRSRTKDLSPPAADQGSRPAENEAGTDAQTEREIEQNERRTIIDKQTRSIVTEERDPATGERVSQLPDETLLKLRAFARELVDRQRAAQAEDALLSRRA